jgi:hypothetical protein
VKNKSGKWITGTRSKVNMVMTMKASMDVNYALLGSFNAFYG